MVDDKWVPALAILLVQGQVWLDDLDGATATIDAAAPTDSVPPILSSVRMPGYAAQIAMLNGDMITAARLAMRSETGSRRDRTARRGRSAGRRPRSRSPRSPSRTISSTAPRPVSTS